MQRTSRYVYFGPFELHVANKEMEARYHSNTRQKHQTRVTSQKVGSALVPIIVSIMSCRAVLLVELIL